MNQTPSKMLSEIEIVASKPRFGLFSQPPPIALGENSLFSQKKANKGQDGKPKTKPRNILAGTNRSGMGRRSYIQVPNSIYQKDLYKDPFKIELQYQRKIRGKSATHQTGFRPASGSRTITNSLYVHIEQKEQRKIKIKKDENGRVKTQPTNIITNPTSKIQEKLFQHVQHMRDEYDREHQLQRQQKQIWKTKVKGETMFRSMSHGNSYLSKEKTIFGVDDRAKMLLSQRKAFKFGIYRRAKHETRFKLARRGHGDPIGRYPEFISPLQKTKTEYSQIAPLNTSKSGSQRELWRPTSSSLSRPTPSISLMARNLRKQP